MNFNTDLGGEMQGGDKRPEDGGQNDQPEKAHEPVFWGGANEASETRDSQLDSGHVSSKPGYGWEGNENKHLAFDPDSHGTVESREIQVPVAGPVRTPVMSASDYDRAYGKREGSNETSKRQGPSWPFWWLLFLVLLLAVGAAIAFGMWDTQLLRDDYFQSEQTLHGRIDSTDTQSQNRLQERASAIELRMDQLWQKVNALETENAVLRARLENTEGICQQSCNGISK